MDRNYSVDFFKAIAIFAVVAIHTNPFAGTMVFGVEGSDIDFVIDTMARFSVALFFAISGYLLYQGMQRHSRPEQKIKTALKRNAKITAKWLSIFVVFSFLMNAIKSLQTGQSVLINLKTYFIEVFALDHIWLFLYRGLFRLEAAYHMWFMVALVGAVVIFYLFYKAAKLKWLLAIAYVLHLIGLTGQSYGTLIEFPFDWRTRDLLFFGLFYFALGAWFAEGRPLVRWLEKKMSNKVIGQLIVALGAVSVGERYVLTMLAGAPNGGDYYFVTHLQVGLLMLFILKNPMRFKDSKLKKYGEHSIGIYLTHTLVIYFTYFAAELVNVRLEQYVLFHLLFTPFVFVSSYHLYNLGSGFKRVGLQGISRKKSRLRKRLL